MRRGRERRRKTKRKGGRERERGRGDGGRGDVEREQDREVFLRISFCLLLFLLFIVNITGRNGHNETYATSTGIPLFKSPV